MGKSLPANERDMNLIPSSRIFHMPWSNPTPRTTATEPSCLEPMFCNKRSHHDEKPVHNKEEEPIGEDSGTPLQYSCLEDPMGGGAWWAAVHGVTKNRTRLSDFTFTFPFHALEKEMATHSSVLAWRIPGTGEPGGLLSMGLHRIRQD